MLRIIPLGCASTKLFCFFLLLIWLNLKVKITNCEIKIVTNKQLTKLLNENDKYFRIQSAVSDKFLTVEEGFGNARNFDNIAGVNKNTSLVTGITVDMEYEKRFDLDHLKDSQIWRVRQSLGFPFRNGSFTPLYKFQSLRTLNHPNTKTFETPWQLRCIVGKGRWQVFEIMKPFKDFCATESQDELVLEDCEKTEGNTKWIFIPAAVPAMNGKHNHETEDFDTYNTDENLR